MLKLLFAVIIMCNMPFMMHALKYSLFTLYEECLGQGRISANVKRRKIDMPEEMLNKKTNNQITLSMVLDIEVNLKLEKE